MKVLVGLGNPGHTYHETRHNVGFMVIQQLAQQHSVLMDQRSLNPMDGRPAAVFGEYQDGEERVRLLMPLTMMNESGEALRDLDVPLQNLLLICDDVSLPLGAIRLRMQGSAGGHHGLESCVGALGTEQVPRLRIGIGTESMPSDLHDFVLSRFASTERPMIKQAIEQAVQACEVWVKEGMEMAMNQYNRVQE